MDAHSLLVERGDVRFLHQSLYCPVTDVGMDTASYEEHASGYHLTAKAMDSFWDAYIPDADRRSEITATPNQATVEQVSGLPPAFVAVDEADDVRLLGTFVAPLLGEPLQVFPPTVRRRDVASGSARCAAAGALVAMMLGLGYTLAAAAPFALGAVRDATGSFDAKLWLCVGVLAVLAALVTIGLAAAR